MRGARRPEELDERALAGEREEALAKLAVSRETVERLDLYVALLRKWQKAVNLVSPSTLPHIWGRHILDSAQIARIGAPHCGWADLGSGAGFPGMVIAILLGRKHSENIVHLIESDARKASFLKEVARLTQAPASVHAERIETAMSRLGPEITAVTARALAPLPRLLELAEPLLTRGAEGFFPKGQTLESEIGPASLLYDFEMQMRPSSTEAKGKIVVIRNLRRRDASFGGQGKG